MYSVSQNNTVCGDVQNMQIQVTNECFWNGMGYVISALKKHTFLVTAPWVILETNAVGNIALVYANKNLKTVKQKLMKIMIRKKT